MQITVNGLPIPAGDINIVVTTDAAGESLPPVNVTVNGGKLTIHRSQVKTAGPISLQLFSESDA